MDSSTTEFGSGCLFGRFGISRVLPSEKFVLVMYFPMHIRTVRARLWSDTTSVAAILLLCVLGVFLLSHQPGSTTGIGWSPPLWYIVERKSAHILEYFLTTLVALRFISLCFPSSTSLSRALATGLFILALAVSDEIHQLFVYARTAKLTDVGFDMLGFLLAIGIFALLSNRRNQRSL